MADDSTNQAAATPRESTRQAEPAASEATAEAGRRAIFRVPGTAMIAVLLLFGCVFPAATAIPALLPLLLIPIGLAWWVARTRTTATRDGITVRTLFGTKELPWEALRGLSITPKSKIEAVLADGSKIALPTVRTRHLPVLSLVSEGRLPDPSGLLDEPS
ncbi:Protein of unknown function (DUF2581) [Saccharomonospora marina XMU15]|uniref:Low molecular weight protein antigen 6 PH domain-containing protein n=1 Tax=Saccharomonospora marina XMU15 TaxID=882083 RepID=H5WYF5_9PSEU|nr:PH domain-containing protein [Saccharomonospora marina]EHR49546.1 Protein of unknown function (DUF2581) [Saccharomonospora marina XMU15]